MAVEQFANNAISTLFAGITSSATTLQVADPSLFPASPQFRIVVDSEIMLVTSINTGTSPATFTVTRGIEGTSAVAHSAGASVVHRLTAGVMATIEQSVLNLIPITGTVDGGALIWDADSSSWVNEMPSANAQMAWSVNPLMFSASSAIPTANIIYYLRITQSQRNITQITTRNGNAVAGNIQVGLYTNTGTGRSARPNTRIAASTAVAQAGTNADQNISLGGTFDALSGNWLAIWAASTTATFVRLSTVPVDGLWQQEVNASGLPATATPVSAASTAILPILYGN